MGNPTAQSSSSSFSGLASSSLPSLGGDSLARPTWKRSLQELAASNMALMNNNNSNSNNNNSNNNVGASSSSHFAAPPTAAAQILLGSRTDFGSLLNNKSFTKKTTTTTTSTTSKLSSQASSSRYSFDAMSGGGIEAVVRRHRDGMLERILKEQREQTQQLLDKAVERQVEDDWRQERNWWRKELVGDRNLVDATNHNNIPSSSDPSAGIIKQRLVGGSTKNNPTTRGLLVADYTGGTNNSLYATGCDPKAMQEHLAVVKQIQPTSDPLRAIASFEQLACTKTFGGGYKNAWMILSSMIPRMQSAIGAAQGAQSHFCKQYQTIINNHVKSASLSGQDGSTSVYYGGNGMASTIASYVKLISGSNASVWETLYYCLRCGDVNAAKAVLNATPAGREQFSEQPILSQVIGQLSERQGSASCMFEVGSPNIMSRDRFNVLDLYQKTKNLDPNNTHKLSVLALLCGQRLESFSTVEDYLFGCLWLALMDKENPIRQIEVIGASVRKYGPSHFAADGSGEWGYVLPLIASQQFETALSYLAEAGGPTGLMQAAHLGIIFAVAGITVADLGDASSSSRGSRDVVTALLVNYATQSEREPSARGLASLEYLLKIPNTEESIYQVANLIHRSPVDQIEALTGVLDAVGNRKNAFLDTRLPEEIVSRIIVTAAELFQKQASDRSKIELSAKLFMLGYNHSKLVQLLNERISSVNETNGDKKFWMDQSELFYNAYLSKRTNVLDSIERAGKLQLINTNRCLLELRSFFDSYRERKFEEAFGKVSRTGLLPFATEELNEKASKFRDLDPILKNEFPAVLSATVECLCELFFRLKSESRGLPQVVLDRLKELEYLARFIFLFSGLINMPSSCKNDIARMRANMIV